MERGLTIVADDGVPISTSARCSSFCSMSKCRRMTIRCNFCAGLGGRFTFATLSRRPVLLLSIWIAMIVVTKPAAAVKVSDGLHDLFELQDCFKLVKTLRSQEMRVINSSSEQPTGSFPQAVSVRRRLTGNHLCTGAIISPGVVFVPASCLDDIGCRQCTETGDRMPEVVIFGEEEPLQTLKRIVHPAYNGDLVQGHDIAILLLANSKHQPLLEKELAVSNVNDSICNSEYRTLSAFGWFRPGPSGHYGPPAKELRKVEDREIVACSNIAEALHGALCSSISDGCEWDRGALLKAAEGCLMGLASFLDPDDCSSPYIFTNISAYREWILEEILQETEGPLLGAQGAWVRLDQ